MKYPETKFKLSKGIEQKLEDWFGPETPIDLLQVWHDSIRIENSNQVHLVCVSYGEIFFLRFFRIGENLEMSQDNKWPMNIVSDLEGAQFE